jgi:hypothetical protein
LIANRFRIGCCADSAAGGNRAMPTNRVYNIAVIPGDGIGKEVVPEGVRVLDLLDVPQMWYICPRVKETQSWLRAK